MVGFWKSGAEGEAQVAKLKELVSENLSFSQIARAMGARTRNIVLCKFNRLREEDPSLKHPSSGSTSRALAQRVQFPRPEKPKPLPEPSISANELVPLRTENGQPINIFNVEPNQCEYPYGDVGDPDFHYCGHPVRVGSHYCDPHHQKCYQAGTARINIGHRGRKRN